MENYRNSIEPEEAKNYSIKNSDEIIEKAKAYQHNEEHQKKDKARQATSKISAKGQSCTCIHVEHGHGTPCGSTEHVEKHHPNYDKPEEVEFHCLPCHRKFERAKIKSGFGLRRRVVTAIEEYLQPKEIFALICKSPSIRDRAMMAFAFCSACRISELVGGPCFRWDKTLKQSVKTGKRHIGVQVDNLHWEAKLLKVSGMKVVKRSHKIIAKYGIQVTRRDDFALPLEVGLFDKIYWDQLVPFTWLIKEYWELEAPKRGKLFDFEDTVAWEIINKSTGMFPNWFRAQGEHFYGHYLLTDSVMLAKFVKIKNPVHVSHYIGYDWAAHLKNAQVNMDFAWIKGAVDKIKNRIGCD